MKLGVSLVDPRASFEEVARAAELADLLGFHSIWTNEGVAREAFVTLTAWGGRTERAILATGISPIALRPPFFAAMAVATLAEAIGPERVWFGIGSGSPDLAARWFEREISSPLAAVREYATIVRRLLRDESVTTRGKAYSLTGAHLRMSPSEPVPVLVGALGPRMIEVACQASDGILLNWNSVEGLQAARAQVDATVDDRPFITATYVRVAVSEDDDEARDRLRRELAAYIRYPAYRAQLAARGFEDIAAEVGRAWEQGDADAAREAIPVEVALQFGVAGTPPDCKEQLKAYEKAGIEHIVVRPVPVDEGGLEPAVRAAADLL